MYQVDYKIIKEEYETTTTSYKKLGVKHEIHYKQIERRAKKDNWIKYNPKALVSQELNSVDPQIAVSVVIDTDKVVSDIKALLGEYHRAIDDVAIMMFIDSYSSFCELQEEIKIEGRVLVSTKTLNSFVNPKVNLLQMEKNNLLRIGKELGVTVASRLKLRLDLEDKEVKNSIFDFVDKTLQGIEV